MLSYLNERVCVCARSPKINVDVIAVSENRLEQVDDRETYVYNGNYWDMRRDPGFVNVNLPKLWWSVYPSDGPRSLGWFAGWHLLINPLQTVASVDSIRKLFRQTRGVSSPWTHYTLTQPPNVSNPSHIKLSQVGYTQPYFQHRWTFPYS